MLSSRSFCFELVCSCAIGEDYIFTNHLRGIKLLNVNCQGPNALGNFTDFFFLFFKYLTSSGGLVVLCTGRLSGRRAAQ